MVQTAIAEYPALSYKAADKFVKSPQDSSSFNDFRSLPGSKLSNPLLTIVVPDSKIIVYFSRTSNASKIRSTFSR